MILSKNAVGNLVNRYKAVLGKCRLINAFGSLALAAMLTLGSAGLTVATPVDWTGGDLTVGTGGDQTSLTVDSEAVVLTGTLTVTDGGMVTVNSPGSISAGDGATPSNGKLVVEGGTLNINGYSDSRDLQITGGTVNIDGTLGNGWRENALGGYAETTDVGGHVASTGQPTLVSGRNTVVNIKSANLFGGAAINFTTAQLKIADGATVNLNGLSPDPSHERDFDDAGMLFTGNGTDHNNPNLLITGAGTTVNIARSNHGVFNAGVTHITDGATVDVQGGLLLTGYLDTPPSEPSKTVAEAMPYAQAGYTKVAAGGNILVGDKGHLVLNQGMTLEVAADGKLNNSGKVNLYAGSTLEYSAGGDHTLTGTVANGGTIQVTDAHLDLTKADLERFGGAQGTAGTIAVARVQDSTSNQMARVDMSDAKLAAWLEEGGSVTVKGNSSLKARLHLGTEATLAAGSITGSNSAMAGKVALLGDGSIQAQNMTLTGDALDIDNVSSNNRIKVNSLTLAPNTPNTDFTLTSGKLYLKGEAGSALNLAGDGALVITNAGELELGEDSNPGGSINANVTSNGKVEVTQGKWTLAQGKELNIATTGSLKVGGGHDGNAAELNIQGTLKSDADGTVGHGNGVNVMNNGVLSGASEKFVTYNAADDSAVIAGAGDLSKIYVANGGTLRLDGLKSINTAQMLNTKTALLAGGSTGLINYGSAVITISDSDKGTSSGSIKSSAAEASSAVLAGKNVEYAALSDAIIVTGGFGADALVVTNNTGGVTPVTANIAGDTTLLGNGGQLITTVGAVTTNVTVAGGKNLNLGSAGAKSNGGTLNGNVALDGVGSALNAAAANFKVGNITANTNGSGNVNASAGGSLTTGDIGTGGLGGAAVAGVTADNGRIVANDIYTGSLNVQNGGSVDAGALVLTGISSKLTVGDANDSVGGSTLVVNRLVLNGGSLLVDPAWGTASSNVAVGTFADSASGNDYEINGNVGVGMNSMAAIGTTDTGWLAGHIKDATNGAGLTQNGITAALGIKEAQVLGTGFGILVDGSMDSAGLGAALPPTLPTAANTLTFADNSLLVVSAKAAMNTDGAISSDNNVTGATAIIDEKAQLRITDAKVGGVYKVLGANISDGLGSIIMNGAGTGWTGSNFSTDSRMIKGSFNAVNGELSTTLNSAANVYPKLDGDLVKVLDNAYTADQVGPSHENSNVKGVRFLSRATSDNFIGDDANLAAKTIESAARIAVAGAVPQMTMAANNAAGAAITQRTSIAQPESGLQSVALGDAQSGMAAGDATNKGMALWIMPLYQSQNAWNMEAGNSYDLKWHGGLGGVALGGDYTFDNALRAGIAFNIGGGYAEGKGDLAKTTNSFSFWGLGAYAGWAVENFGVTADLNYTSTYNKVKQELPDAMQMRDLKSDITAYALSSGLRGEYKFNTQLVDIIPHLGVRYMYVSTDSYDVKSNGTVMHGEQINQNIWTFPIGVTFSKQVETSNGWYVKPSLDLGVLPATGDIEAKSKIRFTGTTTKAELDTHTMDYMSYTGGLGLDFGNDNLSFGVNYNIQASEHSTAQGVFGTVRYEF